MYSGNITKILTFEFLVPLEYFKRKVSFFLYYGRINA